MIGKRGFGTLAGVAVFVVFGDIATKSLAASLLADGPGVFPILPERLRFLLVQNAGAAGGVWLGEHTRAINIALTALVIAIAVPICRELSRVHRWAPVALGLIIGAALGNLTSLVLAPSVVDFIALDIGGGSEIVFNVADVAAAAGIVVLCPIAISMYAQIRAEWTVSRDLPIEATDAPVAVATLTVHVEREVPLAVAFDVPVADRAPRREAPASLEIDSRPRA